MKLGAMVSATGIHLGAWRHPDAQTDGGINFARQAYMAQCAEAACVDFMFYADILAHQPLPRDILTHTDCYIWNMDPICLLSALGAVTSRIGLVGTASTTYQHPYHVARMFGTIDHISGGRAGWNLVTSTVEAEAHNFSLDDHPAKAERYARAEEFYEVVVGLWDSFADDAFIHDRAAGNLFDPAKLRPLDHDGRFFQVKGPLALARPQQGRPVIMQAGSSDLGVALAARTAEAIFTVAGTLQGAQQSYARIKDKAVSIGRDPDSIKVMTGILPVVGESEAHAREKFEQLRDLVHPDLALALLSRAVGGGVDLSTFPLDGPVPELPPSDVGQGRQDAVLDVARSEGLTLRQLALRYASGLGNRNVVGTASQIADAMEEVFLNAGSDGFIIAAPYLPYGLTDFLDQVVPELQRRGLFRTEYEGRTLRENLGLKRPERTPDPHP
jgi:FMN-dependent oxidoreductase (nitrilotriacetate monooxygenase family)